VIVLDTCALLWWTLTPKRLSPKAAKKISDAKPNELLVSAISLWEIGIKNLRSNLDLGMPLERYVATVEQIRNLSIVPVDHRTWIESLQLDWDHRDPADRVIVALATRQAGGLVTDDELIQKFYGRVVW
jgi:PIN domain nuclease of toxin-antitoxin system